MLVVSLRGVNFGFWSHLGCSGQNAIICSPYVAVMVSFRVAPEEVLKYIFNNYVLNMVSFSVKSDGPSPNWSPLGAQ